MNITELFNNVDSGYRTDLDDNTALSVKDTRKTRLTLSRINKLRNMNDVRAVEHEKKLEKIADQYHAPAETGGLGM